MCDTKGRVAEMISPMELVFKEYPLVDPTPGAIVVKIIQANILLAIFHQDKQFRLKHY